MRCIDGAASSPLGRVQLGLGLQKDLVRLQLPLRCIVDLQCIYIYMYIYIYILITIVCYVLVYYSIVFYSPLQYTTVQYSIF